MAATTLVGIRTFSYDEIEHIKTLCATEFANNPHQRIVKLSRRLFRELTNSIYAVKDVKGNIFYHYQLHAHETPPDRPKKVFDYIAPRKGSKIGYVGANRYKIAYDLPSIDGGKDRVWVLYQVHKTDTFESLNPFLKFLDSLPEESRKYFALDGYCYIPSDVKEGYKDVVYIAPKAMRSMRDHYHHDAVGLTFEKKIAFAREIVQAFDILNKNGWAHNDPALSNIRYDIDSEGFFHVKIIDYDTVYYYTKEVNFDKEKIVEAILILFPNDLLKAVFIKLFPNNLYQDLFYLKNRYVRECKKTSDIFNLINSIELGIGNILE